MLSRRMWSAAVSDNRKSASATAASRARVARTALCTMSLRFAFDRDVNEQTEDNLFKNSGGNEARNAFWRSPVAPTLLVMMTTHCVKSTTRPRESVSLPSSSNNNEEAEGNNDGESTPAPTPAPKPPSKADDWIEQIRKRLAEAKARREKEKADKEKEGPALPKWLRKRRASRTRNNL